MTLNLVDFDLESDSGHFSGCLTNFIGISRTLFVFLDELDRLADRLWISIAALDKDVDVLSGSGS